MSIIELTADELVTSAAGFDVVTVSPVQSANGAVLDVSALRDAVKGTGTLTVLDITQALGWKTVDVGRADVTAAAVYRWLLGQRGTAWMSLSDRVSRMMTPHAANWYAGQEPWQTIYGLPLRLADGARRFDASPAWFSALGAGLTLPWLASLDAAAVEAHTVGLAGRLQHRTAATAAGFGDRVDSDREPGPGPSPGRRAVDLHCGRSGFTLTMSVIPQRRSNAKRPSGFADASALIFAMMSALTPSRGCAPIA